jgi:hypothetical protein
MAADAARMTLRQAHGIRGFAAFVDRITNRARSLAEARGELLLRERRGDASRWRNPRLLWPDFTARD